MWHYQTSNRAGAPYFVLLPNQGQSLVAMAQLANQLEASYGLMANERDFVEPEDAWVLEWVQFVRQKGLDPHRAIWLGYGQGAQHLLAYSRGSEGHRIRRLMLLHPHLDEDSVVITPVKRSVFLTAGRHDACAPQTRSQRLYQQFQEQGSQVQFLWTMSGAISQVELSQGRTWLASLSGSMSNGVGDL